MKSNNKSLSRELLVDCMAAYLKVYWALFSRLFSDFIVLSSKILFFTLLCGIIQGCVTIKINIEFNVVCI